MTKPINSRAVASQISWQIIDHGHSLDTALNNYFSDNDLSPQDRGFVQELVYGVCRWYGELDFQAQKLLRSPIRKKDRVIHFVLLTGIYQLDFISTAKHAAVDETVKACKALNKQWAKNLINGCLRNHLRQAQKSVAENEDARHFRATPDWITKEIEHAWPAHFKRIIAANNQRPPMCLRINTAQTTRTNYLAQLDKLQINAQEDPFSKDGIILTQATPVTNLPGFFDGDVSVQDTAAQLACDILQAQPNDQVLDACAAPGGKTAHILERLNNNIAMTALDISERRCEQLHDTLQRLNLQANVYTSDASLTPNWPTPKQGYDRILVDAPCSGLGVIRRHPDIKHHRTEQDITRLHQTQQSILHNLWPLLKPDGWLLYMTCSILPSENEQAIRLFLASKNDAMLQTIKHPNALELEYGVQTLPGVHQMDGFYYALLTKTNDSE